MDFLASKKMSLACAVLNGLFTVQAVTVGNWAWAAICLAFCALCSYNYYKA